MWGATGAPCGGHVHPGAISIHAPRVGCDYAFGAAPIQEELFQSTHPVWGATSSAGRGHHRLLDFNPRTPCGVRPGVQAAEAISRVFQSTHPVWGATGGPFQCPPPYGYFNPRTPCGVRPMSRMATSWLSIFQSTHPVWGATTRRAGSGINATVFQSTHPVWGATALTAWRCRRPPDFNPRTPCGVRRRAGQRTARPGTFQSTHPVWGAT